MSQQVKQSEDQIELVTASPVVSIRLYLNNKEEPIWTIFSWHSQQPVRTSLSQGESVWTSHNQFQQPV